MIEISCGCIALDHMELPSTPVLVVSCSHHQRTSAGLLQLRTFKREKCRVLSEVEEHNVLFKLNQRLSDGQQLQRFTNELRELLGRV